MINLSKKYVVCYPQDDDVKPDYFDTLGGALRLFELTHFASIIEYQIFDADAQCIHFETILSKDAESDDLLVN